MSALKVLIIGAGAMGCRFGFHFQKGGADVCLVDVWKENVEAIKQNGVSVKEQDRIEFVKIPAVLSVKDAPASDLVVIFTKSTQTEDAMKSALTVMGSDTPVMTLQNGLGNLEMIEQYVDKDRIILGSTKTATSMEGPGVIRIEGFAESYIMALGSKSQDVCFAAHDILEAGGMICHIHENIMSEIWRKVAFNSAVNTVTALTRQFPGYLGDYGYELIDWITKEVAQVAAAENIHIDLDKMMTNIRSMVGPDGDKTHFTSMLQDVLREKQTEADFICSPIIRKAKALGIAVPHLETVYNLVKITDGNYGNAAKI